MIGCLAERPPQHNMHCTMRVVLFLSGQIENEFKSEAHSGNYLYVEERDQSAKEWEYDCDSK